VSVELNPCPFCGGEAEIVKVFDGVLVMCKACGLRVPFSYTEEEAARYWNMNASIGRPEGDGLQ